MVAQAEETGAAVWEVVKTEGVTQAGETGMVVI